MGLLCASSSAMDELTKTCKAYISSLFLDQNKLTARGRVLNMLVALVSDSKVIRRLFW